MLIFGVTDLGVFFRIGGGNVSSSPVSEGVSEATSTGIVGCTGLLTASSYTKNNSQLHTALDYHYINTELNRSILCYYPFGKLIL